jgi:hypothetical protein
VIWPGCPETESRLRLSWAFEIASNPLANCQKPRQLLNHLLQVEIQDLPTAMPTVLFSSCKPRQLFANRFANCGANHPATYAGALLPTVCPLL